MVTLGAQLSEINLRNYMQSKGLRFKLTKTDAELVAEGTELRRRMVREARTYVNSIH